MLSTLSLVITTWNRSNNGWTSTRVPCRLKAETLKKKAAAIDVNEIIDSIPRGAYPPLRDASTKRCFCCGQSATELRHLFTLRYEQRIATAGLLLFLETCDEAACQRAARDKTDQAHVCEARRLVRQCASCRKTGGKLFRCGGCELVYYCSKDCQRSHRDDHGINCIPCIHPLLSDAERYVVRKTYYCWRPDRRGFVAQPMVIDVTDKATAMQIADMKIPNTATVGSVIDWADRCFCGGRTIQGPHVNLCQVNMRPVGNEDAHILNVVLLAAYTCEKACCMNGCVQVMNRIFAEVQEAGWLVRVCAWCAFISERPMKKCSVCRDTYYCSPACQKADWAGHRSAKCTAVTD